MKSQKNKVLLATALIALSSAAFAFGPFGGGGPMRGGMMSGEYSADDFLAMRANHLARTLNLSDSQKDQIVDIMKVQHDEAEKWRDTHQQQTQDKFAEVLTAEQLDEFKAIQEERKNRHESGSNNKRWRRGGNGCR